MSIYDAGVSALVFGGFYVVEFVAIVRAIGADPIKLLRDLMAGKPPTKPRRASAK